MKKDTAVLFTTLAAGVGIGICTVRFTSDAKPVSSPSSFLWELARKQETGLSPVLFEARYFRVKESIELKFEKQVALIDGEVFGGDNLGATLQKMKEQKKAVYLVLFADENERFGLAIERLPHLRSLGFERVILMTNHKFE